VAKNKRWGMRETSKAYRRRVKDPFWDEVFVGRGLDIGSGDDPFLSEWWEGVVSVETFDRQDGNAEEILRFPKGRKGAYDFVHSSNCLEHMSRPRDALLQWLALLRPGGHLVLTVPDEDLYEQGVWPSRWNRDHKYTFTIWKAESWSEMSVNVAEMLAGLDGYHVRRLQVVDTGYDRSKRGVDQTRRSDGAEAFLEVVIRRAQVVPGRGVFKHSGARGDIIYSLPAMEALGGGVLAVAIDPERYVGRPMSEKDLAQLAELLRRQPYVEDVVRWDGSEPDWDLDLFRDLPTEGEHLARQHLDRFGVERDLAMPWIDPGTVEPLHEADIVVARSSRYHGPMDWAVLKPHESRCVFVGFEDEHEAFVKETGVNVGMAGPLSVLELASVIRGSKLFVGNQSFPYAIAEAMKVPRALEVCPSCPNCMPRGPDGHVGITARLVDDHLGDEIVLGLPGGDPVEHRPWRVATPTTRSEQPRRWKPVPGRPMFSVVAVHDGDDVDGAVERVRELHVNDAIEVLMLIRGSVDQAALAREAVARALGGDAVSVAWTPTRTWGAAMNDGVSRTSGDFICVARDDFEPWKGWVRHLVDLFRDERAGLVGTTMVTDHGFPHVDGACLVLSRRAYEEVGMFDDRMELGGPWLALDLSMRMMDAGYAYRHCNKIKKWKGVSASAEAEARNRAFILIEHGVEV